MTCATCVLTADLGSWSFLTFDRSQRVDKVSSPRLGRVMIRPDIVSIPTNLCKAGIFRGPPEHSSQCFPKIIPSTNFGLRGETPVLNRHNNNDRSRGNLRQRVAREGSAERKCDRCDWISEKQFKVGTRLPSCSVHLNQIRLERLLQRVQRVKNAFPD